MNLKTAMDKLTAEAERTIQSQGFGFAIVAVLSATAACVSSNLPPGDLIKNLRALADDLERDMRKDLQ